VRTASIGVLAAVLSAGVAAGVEPNDLDRELVEIVTKGLRYNHAEVRESAAGVVRSVGARLGGAADALAAALAKETEKKPRLAMASALVILGAPAAKATERVLGSAKRESLHALADAAARGKTRAIDLLRVLGKCPDATVQAKVRPALKRAGEGAGSWREGELAGMAKADSATRKKFLVGVMGGGVRPEHEPFLIGCLGDTDPWVREQAASFLGDIEPHTKRKIDALEAALAKADSRVGQTMMRSMAKAGDPGIDALVRALNHPDRLLRASAAFHLAQLGPAAERALPALEGALKKAQMGFKASFEEAIAKVSGNEESLKRKYVEDLRAKPKNRRDAMQVRMKQMRAINQLSMMGRDAVYAKDALWEFIRDTDYSRKNSAFSEQAGAMSVLVRIGKPAAEHVMEAVRHPKKEVRDIADRTMKRSSVDGVMEILIQVLRERDPELRLWALRILDQPAWMRKLAPAAEEIVALAGATDGEVRRLVASLIKKAGVSVKDRTKLLAGLKSRNFVVRKQTALALAKGAAPPDEAIPVLAEILTRRPTGDRSRGVRDLSLALEALAKARARARPALAAIREAMPGWLDPNRRVGPGVQLAAIKVLANFPGETEDSLLLALEKGSSKVREGAAAALAKRGTPTLEKLLARCGDKAERTKLTGMISALASAMGRSAVGPLIKRLTSRDRQIAGIASSALRAIGPPAVDPLLELAKSRDRAAAHAALDVLHDIGPAAKPAVPLALRLSRSNDKNTRWRALTVLAAAGGGNPEAVDALLKALTDSDRLIRMNVARIISLDSVPAEKALPVLGSLLDDKDSATRSWVILSLGHYGEVSLPYLREAFADPHDGNRDVVVHSLAQIGPVALPVVAGALTARNPVVRETAADSLKRFGAIGVIPLLDAYREGKGEVRAFAKERLKGMGKIATPGLLDMLR
jgi:HEAT repeat protein